MDYIVNVFVYQIEAIKLKLYYTQFKSHIKQQNIIEI